MFFLLSNNFRAEIKIKFRIKKIDNKKFKNIIRKIINQYFLF
jgi:hypothetical protein